MTKTTPAHSEFAVKVVSGRCCRERLDGAQRIIEHDTAQGLQVASVQHGTGRGGLRLVLSRTTNGNVLFVAARGFRQPENELLRLTGADVNGSAEQRISDERR
jgi:hypothetical protein